MPHAPQFCGSFEGMHQPSQKIWPEGQTHALDQHLLPPVQTFPHVPQLFGSAGMVHWWLHTMEPVLQPMSPWQV